MQTPSRLSEFMGFARVRTVLRQTKRQTEVARGRRAVDSFHSRLRAMPEVRRLRNAAKLAKRREVITAKAVAAAKQKRLIPIPTSPTDSDPA